MKCLTSHFHGSNIKDPKAYVEGWFENEYSKRYSGAREEGLYYRILKIDQGFTKNDTPWAQLELMVQPHNSDLKNTMYGFGIHIRRYLQPKTQFISMYLNHKKVELRFFHDKRYYLLSVGKNAVAEVMNSKEPFAKQVKYIPTIETWVEGTPNTLCQTGCACKSILPGTEETRAKARMYGYGACHEDSEMQPADSKLHQSSLELFFKAAQELFPWSKKACWPGLVAQPPIETRREVYVGTPASGGSGEKLVGLYKMGKTIKEECWDIKWRRIACSTVKRCQRAPFRYNR